MPRRRRVSRRERCNRRKPGRCERHQGEPSRYETRRVQTRRRSVQSCNTRSRSCVRKGGSRRVAAWRIRRDSGLRLGLHRRAPGSIRSARLSARAAAPRYSTGIPPRTDAPPRHRGRSNRSQRLLLPLKSARPAPQVCRRDRRPTVEANKRSCCPACHRKHSKIWDHSDLTMKNRCSTDCANATC